MVDRKQQPEPASPVRERARKHLRNLLATSAVTGAAAKMAACIPVVCDPMPPPLTCDASQDTSYYVGNTFVSAQAQWVLGAGNSWTVSVVVNSNSYASDGRITFSADPVVIGATVGPVTRTETQVSFSLTPETNATSVRVDLAISCQDVADALRFRLDVSGERENNGNIPMQSADGEDR
jgi:hypothetical protein